MVKCRPGKHVSVRWARKAWAAFARFTKLTFFAPIMRGVWSRLEHARQRGALIAILDVKSHDEPGPDQQRAATLTC